MRNDRILYLTRAEMDDIGPSFAEVIDLLDQGFRYKAQGKTVMPPKHWLERSDDRFYSAMSSYIPELGYGGCKWQSGDPVNSQRGLPYIQGLYVLTEDTLGVPVALMDSEWITGRRTAAASALAVKYLAPADASSLAILGCGLQGRAHLYAIHAVMPNLKTVLAYDIRRSTADQFAEELGEELGIEIVAVDSPRAAVADANVVISGGPIMTPPAPVIEADWLRDGTLGVSIDYDSYWTAEAMRSMDLITTDDEGQIEHLKEFGLFLGLPRIDCDLASIINGKNAGNISDKKRILCFNLGVAIEDLVTAVDIYNRAKASNVGTSLPR